MRNFTSLIGLSACLFALLCLSSVGYASPPSVENDVHFCEVLDFEDMRGRDSLYAATKQALNLNVGEPRTVRMIYFLPNDRPFRQEVVDSMKVTMRQVQTFYADQMEAHGYGDRTFRFETDAGGDPMVHRVDGQYPDSHYFGDTYVAVLDELGSVFDLGANIYFIAIDNRVNRITYNDVGVAGVGGRRGKSGGIVLVPGGFSFHTAAHELGHAFGLWHDFRDNEYIMSYGRGRYRLSACNAEFLAVHPYFNSNTSIEMAQSPSIELLSPQTYPPGSKSISIQLKVSDSDGLHQVIFLAKKITIVTIGASSPEMMACRGLNGEREAIVEFEYNGVIPPDISSPPNLSNTPSEIVFLVVDIDGNETRRSFIFSEESVSNIATLEGHTGRVNSVLFSPDGQTLAIRAGWDIRLWDVATGRERTTLEHRGVESMSFSPDGSILASGARDLTVVLWDVATGRKRTTLEGHRGGVWSVSFSPDGSILASGSEDHTVVLWDVAAGRERATLRHTDRVSSVSFSPDGTILASKSEDHTVVLWDVATGRERATLRHTDRVSSVSFSPDGSILASGSGDHTVVLWDVATGRERTTLEGHKSGVTSVLFSPDGSTLASASFDNTVVLWDVVTGRVLTTLEGHKSGVTSVSFSPGGSILAAGSYDGTVVLLDGYKRTWLTGHTDAVSSVSFSPDGSILASGSYDHTVKLWDTSELTRPRPRTLVKISGDNQQGTPGAALANAYVVEVRDQYGNPLQGARVTFIIASGQGRFSGRFTDENAITDANGRAQSTLTLGPNMGKNTVKVSVAGVVGLNPVTFNAVGVGTPAIPILGSDYQTWHLPDGAIVRLGKGFPIGEVAFSPDGQRLAVPSKIGIWIYDTATELELALLTGHPGWVYSVSFSPDGSTLATAGDGTVVLWDVVTGREIATLEHSWLRGLTGRVSSVSFSPDGSTLASSWSYDHTVVLWDVATGRERTTLEGHKSGVTSVSFSPDGSTLATAGDGTVVLWDVVTGRERTTLAGHTYGVYSVSFSPDGSTLATGSRDNTVRLWDVEIGRVLTTLEGHKSGVTSVSFSPDGSTLATAGDGTVKLWDVVTGREITTFRRLDGSSASFSPDGSTLAIRAVWDIRLWDVATTNSTRLAGHVVSDVSFSPDGSTLATVGDGTAGLWDIVTGRLLTTLAGHVVSDVSFSPDGSTLATAGDSRVVLWDIVTGRLLTTLEHSWVNKVLFSPDGSTLVSESRDYTVRLWDVATGRERTTLEGYTGEGYSVSFSPDGSTLAAGSRDEIKLWDVETGRLLTTLEHSWVSDVLFSPDGSTLASGSRDGTVVLWDVATGRERTTLAEHADHIYSMSFSPDGSILAAETIWFEIKLWDVATGRERTTLAEHADHIYSMSFSPDGSTLASGSRDEIKLWDVATGRERTTLRGHTDRVFPSFSPDGQTLASMSYDGTALLWDVSEYVTPVVSIPDANLREVVRNALGKSPSAPITMTDMTSLTALDASNRNIRSLTGLEAATNLTELNLTGNPLSSLSINTHIPTLQERGVEVSFDKPTTLVKVSGDEQEGTPGAALANPLVVEVKDQNGNALEGVEVTFSVTEGDGTLSAKTATTDSNGRAQTMLTLGDALKPTVVTVTVAGVDEPVIFTSEAMATPDFDGDGTVGVGDFLLFVEQFGFSQDDAGYDARFDLDGDGIIGIGDFMIFANSFGKAASALEGSGG